MTGCMLEEGGGELAIDYNQTLVALNERAEASDTLRVQLPLCISPQDLLRQARSPGFTTGY